MKDHSNEPDTEAILHIHEEWMAREVEGPLSVLSLCTEDIEFVLGPDSRIKGKKAVKKWILQNSQSVLLAIKIKKRQVAGLGNLACLSASFRTTYREDIHAEVKHIDGHHFWVLKKVANGWRVSKICWKTS